MSLSQLERLNATLASRYTLDRELGRGGMATVYLARDLKHQREVAIKVFRPEVAAALGADRFRREIELAASLNHPHILPLYDSGDVDGLLFYVTPYIKGESLRRVLERDQRVPLDRAIALTRQIAAALDYAHAHDVIHRDIKPENILLHEGEAMVADFGIALAVTGAPAERLTQPGLLLGTPEYMSPEQALGEHSLDPRSDVYALGCLLYELITGEPPFIGPPAMVVAAKRTSSSAIDGRRLRDLVPAGVARALITAMARLPADRFSTAAAFAEALGNPATGPDLVKAIAVLPFLNLSSDPENEYFTDGVTEDIIAQLSKIRALKVISRASVMRFKAREQSLRDISAALEASFLLDGSVRRAGDRVRIVANLIDAETDQHLWAETYDRELTDVFAIQSDVALRIASALQTELSPAEQSRIRKEPTQDLLAYQLYLQGRQWFLKYTAEGMRKGVEYYERAIELDPQYALAYAGIALAYAELAESGSMPPDEAYRHAKQAAATALSLDPGLSEAHFAAGTVKFLCDFDWAAAEREYQIAIDLNPNSADSYDLYGRVCSALQRFDQAIEMERRAQQLDPMAHRSDLATSLLRAGRYEEAVREAERTVESDPEYDRAHATVGWAYLKTGRQDQGLAELERAVAMSPDNTGWFGQLGQAYAEAGRTEAAREILQRLLDLSSRRYVSPYHVAYVYTGLRELDLAMDWLERAYRERAGAVYGIRGSFLFAPLRSHPRFVALLKTMNLT